MVSLFYQQVVLEITFISTQLGPVAFCDNWIYRHLLFKVIKMSNSSLISYLEMGTLIRSMHPLWIYWNFSLVSFLLFLHMILYLQHSFWRRASVNCLFAHTEWWKHYCLLFFDLRYKALGNNSLFLTINFKKINCFGKFSVKKHKIRETVCLDGCLFCLVTQRERSLNLDNTYCSVSITSVTWRTWSSWAAMPVLPGSVLIRIWYHRLQWHIGAGRAWAEWAQGIR